MDKRLLSTIGQHNTCWHRAGHGAIGRGLCGGHREVDFQFIRLGHAKADLIIRIPCALGNHDMDDPVIINHLPVNIDRPPQAVIQDHSSSTSGEPMPVAPCISTSVPAPPKNGWSGPTGITRSIVTRKFYPFGPTKEASIATVSSESGLSLAVRSSTVIENSPLIISILLENIEGFLMVV